MDLLFSRYFSDLRDALERTEATGPGGAPLDRDGALGAAAHLIREQVAVRGGKLMFIGNGGSASVASHMAIDYWKNGNLRAVCFNDGTQLTCLGNDFGYAHVFEKPIEMFAQPGDILIAISSSGRSENILRGADAARRMQCRVVTCSGFTVGNPLRSKGELNFFVPSDSYGFVEIAHLALCHAILDLMPHPE